MQQEQQGRTVELAWPRLILAVALTIGSWTPSAAAELSPAVSATTTFVDLTGEGSADWVHWGLSSASSVNRKSGVAAQIGDITTLGVSERRFQGSASNWPTYIWNDGAPTGSASTTSGLYFVRTGNGAEFTVPADTALRTLRVYLGGFKSRAQIELSLSDGSAAPYVATIEDLSGSFSRVLTVSYSAASAGQTLTVRYSMLTGSNIALQAATLQGAAANAAPVLAPIGDKTATVGSELRFDVQATDADGPAPLLLSHSTLPPGAQFIPDPVTPGRGSFSWTPASGDLPGPYNVTFTATEDNGLGQSDEETIQIALDPGGASGSLLPSVSGSTTFVDLTGGGSADWVHWGLSSASSVNRKSGVAAQIGGITTLGVSARRFQGSASNWPTYSWTDGAPTGSASTTSGLYFVRTGNGAEFTVPADTTVRTLRVYLGGFQSRAQIELSLSDGSAAPYVATIEDLSGPFSRVLTVSYSAASAGQTLTVRYSMLTGGNIALQAATLQGAVAALDLPFTDEFGDGNSDGWLFSNDTPSADAWAVTGGELVQSSIVESVNSFEESYHLGTYAWLPSGLSLTDYEFSVQARWTDPSRPDSMGILFRYRDPNNYYRLTVNPRYGFVRLEKRESGVFFTLARNAIGVGPDADHSIVVDLTGPDIRISIDGTPQLAASDSSHSSGTVGVFTQASAAFDNVVVSPQRVDGDIRISQPADLAVVVGNTVDVDVLVRNLPVGGSVELSVPGESPVILSNPPWSASFTGLTQGESSVTARLRDAGNNTIDQHIVNIAIDEIYALAIGDSITNGAIDAYGADNDDAQRVKADRGYASTLAALLESLPPTEVIAYNEGIGGDTAEENDLIRLQSILERHPQASDAFVQFGTNDALANVSAADFESSMQSIVDRLAADGITVYVATVPPILGGANPLASADNSRVNQYNSVIEGNLTGALPGADLWSFFAPDDTGDGIADRIRADLYADNLHPNALGHSIIATLWYNVIIGDSTGTSISPFLVDRISRSAYKQSLLESGDNYLIDSNASMQTIPAELGDAIWIMTAQSDASASGSDFLSFELDRAATVYVAYDNDAAQLPDWLAPSTSAFVGTGLTVQTTQTTYSVYSMPASAGTVTLGGNLAIGSAGATDMYLVGVSR